MTIRATDEPCLVRMRAMPVESLPRCCADRVRLQRNNADLVDEFLLSRNAQLGSGSVEMQGSPASRPNRHGACGTSVDTSAAGGFSSVVKELVARSRPAAVRRRWRWLGRLREGISGCCRPLPGAGGAGVGLGPLREGIGGCCRPACQAAVVWGGALARTVPSGRVKMTRRPGRSWHFQLSLWSWVWWRVQRGTRLFRSVSPPFSHSIK
jgi:hypothetical protein